MYLHKILIVFIFQFAFQVHGQSTEILGSGDGQSENATYSKLPLLDDNGEISSNESTLDVSLDDDKEASFDNSTENAISIGETSEDNPISYRTLYSGIALTPLTFFDSTESIPSTTSTTTKATTTVFADSTTEEDITTASTTSTSTSTTTTTTTITTEATVKTTKKPIKTDSITEADQKTKPNDKTTKEPPTPASSSTVAMPEVSDKRCFFKDTELECDVQLICYGEGEIDCTDDDDDEMDSDDLGYMNEKSSPNLDGDSSDVADGKTNETSQVKKISFSTPKVDYVWASPAHYMDKISTSKEAEKTDPISNPATSAIPTVEEYLQWNDTVYPTEPDYSDEQVYATEGNSVQDSEPTKPFISVSLITESTEESEALPSNVTSSHVQFSETPHISETLFENVSSTQSIDDEKESTTEIANEAYIEDSETASLFPEKMSTYALETTEEDEPEIKRRKRDKGANATDGYYISNYKVSELESSKKKLKMKLCVLKGNIVCAPRPSKSVCSGKAFCRVPLKASETVEKPATPKGLEKWTIAVIVICAITASCTIALLMYLVFTSYKKLKVQPQNEVTTLNYVNSAQP